MHACWTAACKSAKSATFETVCRPTRIPGVPRIPNARASLEFRVSERFDLGAMLLEIAMHPADVNAGAQQRFVDLFILRKTRCRNQSIVRLFVLTLPLSRQGATCRVYRYSAEDRPILENDCDLGIRFKKRSKAGR